LRIKFINKSCILFFMQDVLIAGQGTKLFIVLCHNSK
jgi:hypothetical protein